MYIIVFRLLKCEDRFRIYSSFKRTKIFQSNCDCRITFSIVIYHLCIKSQVFLLLQQYQRKKKGIHPPLSSDCIRESLNHETAEVGRHLYMSSGPTSPLTYGYPDSRETNKQTKTFFQMFRDNLLCFSLCPLLVLLLVTNKKQPVSILYALSLQVFIEIKIPPSLFFSNLKSCVSLPLLIGEIFLPCPDISLFAPVP